MSNLDLLNRLGIFIVKNFLEPEICQQILLEIDDSPIGSQAEVFRYGSHQVDEALRSTKVVKPSKKSRLLVTDQLTKLQPQLATYYSVPLRGFEPVEFLQYKEADFFVPHRDSSNNPADAEFAKQRTISVVIFLNDASEVLDENSYSGGPLILYGVNPEPRWQKIGFPVYGETGLLIAFRSELLHEVAPVTKGERYTIVSWFF